MSQKLVTIQDIAKLAEVTDMTVSRVLSGRTLGKRRDAKERAEKIMSIAEKLGYHPSNLAKSLRAGHSCTIGMVVGGLSYHHFGCMTEHVVYEANRLNYKTLLQITSWDKERELEALKDLLRYRVDGIIYACSFPEMPDPIHKRLLKDKFPLLALEVNPLPFASASNDYAVAIGESVKYLADLGHKEIAFSSIAGTSSRSAKQEEEFRKACKDCKVKAEIFRCIQEGDPSAILDARPSAVLVDGELMMNAVVKGASEISGYKPDLIGFYTEWSWVRHNPAIKGAIMVQEEQRVRSAVQDLIAEIENPGKLCSKSFEAKFFPSREFDAIRYKPLDVLPLYTLNKTNWELLR